MTDEKRKLVDEYWDHMRTRQRAWVRMMNANQRLINANPAHVEDLQRESLLAGDAMIEADRAGDLALRDMAEVASMGPLMHELIAALKKAKP